ncbi:hypothetical protein [Phytomonospora endophytica]|uniref:Calcium-binding protein n=1 Tax=Phytomonospora endophytica TaxID=714109 RepID=A0A841FTL3_9ACTN|nr:hypothetical protein [Phytomonospora endophytica]MBB6036882.1 hypothetical protein [Phytomonospora endophytica]GIG68084.1 hypothetical protein Pen01_43790 [Phytomonospora endophytica]
MPKGRTVGVVALVVLAAGAVWLGTRAYASGSTCTVNGESVTGTVIEGTGGDDRVECPEGVGEGVTVRTGDGDDTVVATGVAGRGEPGTPANAGVIETGPGEDTVTLTGAAIDADALRRELRNSAGNSGTVDVGGGDDTVTVTGGSGGEPDAGGRGFVGNTGAVLGGPGDDGVELVGGAGSNGGDGNAGTVDGGDGDDTIRAKGVGAYPDDRDGDGGVGNTGSIDGGPGADRLVATGGDGYSGGNGNAVPGDDGPGSRAVMRGGDGDDVVIAVGGNPRLDVGHAGNGTGERGELHGDAGDDSIEAAPGIGGREGEGNADGVFGGPGTDRCDVDDNGGTVDGCE